MRWNEMKWDQGFHVQKLRRATKNSRDQSGARDSKLFDNITEGAPQGIWRDAWLADLLLVMTWNLLFWHVMAWLTLLACTWKSSFERVMTWRKSEISCWRDDKIWKRSEFLAWTQSWNDNWTSVTPLKSNIKVSVSKRGFSSGLAYYSGMNHNNRRIPDIALHKGNIYHWARD